MSKESPQENPYASPEVFGEQFRRAAADFGQPNDGDAPIYAEGVLSERDYLRAVRRVYRWRFLFGRLVVLLVGAVYGGLFWTMLPLGGGAGWRGFLLARLPLILVVGAGVALLLSQQTARFRKAWRARLIKDEPVSLRFTREVIEVSRPSAYILMRWTNYTQYRVCDDDLAILSSAHAVNQFDIFPLSFFTPPEWERFVKLVEEKLPKK
ncbi:MAG: hypothetical protein SGJ19_15980 [Planctomycetia bacterium]|nr:hypothetical protein [Planctomycetia bacterium]